jgi:hypothetical protein
MRDGLYHEVNSRKDSLLPAFAGLVAIYCAWILSLPLFPAQDSPMHLYIASVLSSLLSGSNHFSSYFYVKHLITPYSFHYYFLILVGRLFSFPIADKLLVCTIIVCSACGFRYLALTVGPSGDVVSLFAIPLLLGWPIGMGYYNYAMSLGFTFWAIGFWNRASSTGKHKFWLAFLLTIALMTLTHPVPVILVIALAGFHLICRASQAVLESRQRQRLSQTLYAFRYDFLCLMLASLSLVYISHFAVQRSTQIHFPSASAMASIMGAEARAQYLSLFAGVTLATQLNRLALYVILIVAVASSTRGIRARLSVHKSSFGDILQIGALILGLSLPLIPPSSGDVVSISSRLIIVVWIISLAASSGHKRLTPRVRMTMAACACFYAMAVLLLANYRIRPVANQLAQISKAPEVSADHIGLGLELKSSPTGQGLSFDPYFWTAARYFRRTNSIMLNSGWLYQNYIALGSRADQVIGKLPRPVIDTPWMLEELLLRSPADQGKILPKSDLLVFVGYARQPQDMITEVRAIDRQEPQRAWNCLNRNWYFVCTAPKLPTSQ